MKSPLLQSTVVITCLAGALAPAAYSQSYPSKPIRVIVASSAGSNPDTIGRIIGNGLSQALGQQVVIDNRAGAGGNIGGEIAARAPADGYTVFLAHTNHSINAHLYKKLTYDILADFAPVSMMALSYFAAAVHPSLPVKSIAELIKLAKSRPGDLTYASAGTGSGTYFTAEYFNGLAGIKMLHVAYKGGGPATAAVLSGETSVYFTPVATGLAHIRSGRLRALAVSSKKPLAELPGLAPIADTLPGFEMYSWAGFLVPVKAPKSVVETLHKAAVATIASPDVAKRLKDQTFVPVGSTPEEMAAQLRREIDKYAKLIKTIGLPPQ